MSGSSLSIPSWGLGSASPAWPAGARVHYTQCVTAVPPGRSSAQASKADCPGF